LLWFIYCKLVIIVSVDSTPLGVNPSASYRRTRNRVFTSRSDVTNFKEQQREDMKMSIEEKKKEKIEEQTGDNKKYDAITDNVALLKSRVIILEREADEKDALIAELKDKLSQATEFIEGDQKKMLLAEISPKVDIPDEILMLKSLDELKSMKKTLDVTRTHTFTAGTRVIHEKKPSARQELDDMNKKYMAKLRGET